jgi:hypothetical protein
MVINDSTHAPCIVDLALQRLAGRCSAPEQDKAPLTEMQAGLCFFLFDGKKAVK